jgi:hypothetical protein
MVFAAGCAAMAPGAGLSREATAAAQTGAEPPSKTCRVTTPQGHILFDSAQEPFVDHVIAGIRKGRSCRLAQEAVLGSPGQSRA